MPAIVASARDSFVLYVRREKSGARIDMKGKENTKKRAAQEQETPLTSLSYKKPFDFFGRRLEMEQTRV